MDGYNTWKEYPDEIDIGSLIRIGDEYAKIIRVIAPKTMDGLYMISFQIEEKDSVPHLSGDILMAGNRTIETFTEQPG